MLARPSIPAVGHARGVSLVELIAVMLILSVMAFGAAPAVRSMTSAREGAAARQLTRLLQVTRAHATATGQPTGLIYDAAADTFTFRRIEEEGDPPTPAPDPLGGAMPEFIPALAYPGVTVIGFVTGDADPGHTVVWFSDDGTPQVRSANGDLISEFTQDAVITVTGGKTVRVRRTTGAIE